MAVKKWKVGQIRNGYQVLQKDKRKKILFIGDLLFRLSGVGSQTLQIIRNTCHHYNYINVGYNDGMPNEHITDVGDFSQWLQEETGVEDADLKIVEYNFYSMANPNILMDIIHKTKPQALIHFTDPRSWVWMYQYERYIRSLNIPIIYYHVWDNVPYARYNEPYYGSCDLIMNISKLTHNMVKNVSQHYTREDWQTVYVPHGISQENFKPVGQNNREFINYKKQLKCQDYDFTILHLNKNMDRKNQSSMMQSWRDFMYTLPEEKRKRCRLILKTDPYSYSGIPLVEVFQCLIKDMSLNISIMNKETNQKELNFLYNSVDFVCSNSDAEGFGLATAEALMAGTPIIATVLGGLQDQMRFEDENGKWIDFRPDFPSNSYKGYEKHGKWALPLWPTSTKITGSIPTPYIYYMYPDKKSLTQALIKGYNISKEERKQAGLAGRQWMLSEQSGMSSTELSKSFIKYVNIMFEKYTKRQRYEFIKIKKINKLEKSGVYDEYNKRWY